MMSDFYGIPISALVLLGMLVCALLLWLLHAAKQRLSQKQGDEGWTQLEQAVAEMREQTESTDRPASDHRNE